MGLHPRTGAARPARREEAEPPRSRGRRFPTAAGSAVRPSITERARKASLRELSAVAGVAGNAGQLPARDLCFAATPAFRSRRHGSMNDMEWHEGFPGEG